MKPPTKLDKNILLEAFENNGKIIARTAKALDVQDRTVKQALIHYNIPFNLFGRSKILKEDLEILYNKLGNMNAVAEYLNVSNVTVKNYLREYDIEHKKQVRYICDHEFFSRDTPESFYLAGLWSADGNVRIDPKGTYYVRISLIDEELVKKIKSVFKSDAPIRSDEGGLTNILGRECMCKPQYGLDVCSKQMFNDIARFNVVPTKTHIYTFPQWIKNHPLVHHFIRGSIDGDGSFYLKHKNNCRDQVFFNLMGTFDLVSNVQQIFEREKIVKPNRIINQTETSPNCWSISYGGNGIVSRMFDFLYKDATIYLERKYELAKSATELREFPGRKLRSVPTKEEIEKLYMETRSQYRVADILDLSVGRISNLMKEYGITALFRGSHGDVNYIPKK